MSPDNADARIQQTLDRPSKLGRALEVEARRQADHDSHRRPVFEDARRREAADYEEKSLNQSITHLGFLPAGQEPTDRFSNRTGREKGPERNVSGGETDEHLRARHRLELDGTVTADQIWGVPVPFTPALDLTRTVAAHAGLVEGRNQLQPTRDLRTAIGNGRHDRPLRNASDRETGNDPIEQLAPKYTAPLHGQRERIVSARDIPGHDAGFKTALIDTLTSNQRDSQGEIGANERGLLADGSGVRGLDQGFQSLRIAKLEAQADRTITNDLMHDGLAGASAIGSILRGFGEMINQSDRRADPNTPIPTIDRADGWKSGDDSSPNAAANGSAQDAMAMAGSELERLRTAVRRTIDELERVRGSVQPPLPALPVNRGAFRIS